MYPFIKVGSRIINPAHIVSAQWLDPEPANEKWDAEVQETVTVSAKPARVRLVLSSLDYQDLSWDGRDGFKPFGVSISDTVTVSGDDASRLWDFLSIRTDDVHPVPKRKCDWYPGCRNEALPDDIFCAEHRRQEDALPSVDPADEYRGAPAP